MRTESEIERAVSLLMGMAIAQDESGDTDGITAILACVSVLQWVKGDNSGPLAEAILAVSMGHQVTGMVS